MSSSSKILNITSQLKNVQYIKDSTTQLYQCVGQCRSRHTLSLNIKMLYLYTFVLFDVH
jgi:hypothetical protein